VTRRVLVALWTLAVRFFTRLWRRWRPAPPAPVDLPPVAAPAPLPDTQEAKTAIHEAGLVVAAWFCTFVDEITLAQIHDEGGDVRHVVRGSSEAVAWCRMVITLAGVAAEAHVYRRWRSGESSFDLSRVREVARTISGTRPPWHTLRLAAHHGIDKAYAPPLTTSEADVIQAAYAMARHLLVRHEIRLYRTAGLLLHRRSITQADLVAALGSRTLIRFAAVTRGFWLP